MENISQEKRGPAELIELSETLMALYNVFL